MGIGAELAGARNVKNAYISEGIGRIPGSIPKCRSPVASRARGSGLRGGLSIKRSPLTGNHRFTGGNHYIDPYPFFYGGTPVPLSKGTLANEVQYVVHYKCIT